MVGFFCKYKSICIQVLNVFEIYNIVFVAYSRDTPCFGVARIGQPTQQIVSGPMHSLLNQDFGAPLHSFVIAGTMHPVEEEMYNYYLPK